MVRKPQTGRGPGVDRRRCSGCGRCVGACTRGVLSLEREGENKVARVGVPDCVGCGQGCVAACLLEALEPPGEPRLPVSLPPPAGDDGGQRLRSIR